MKKNKYKIERSSGKCILFEATKEEAEKYFAFYSYGNSDAIFQKRYGSGLSDYFELKEIDDDEYNIALLKSR